nr:P-selectin-like [Ciona intestinalis]|eukprot:XP_026691074.1 P-selectin-like [Ciona intestinalis]
MKQFLQTRICALAIFLLFNKPAVPQELNVKCPSFTHFSNGRIICSNSNNIGSICYFYCNETYELNGDSNTVCHSGIWSNSKPSCFRSFSTEPPILCHILQSFSNGEVSCTNGNHAGSVCSYTCFLGYKLVGNQQTVCHFQGWSATPPVCKKSTQVAARIGSCTPLQHPFHGHFTCSNAYHFLSSCIFSCQNYYKLKGSPNTRCLYSGWTNQPPQCTRDLAIKGRNTFCAYEPYPLASRVTCTDARNSGSVCTYTCIELFELSGSATRTCVSGSWDNPQPSCSAMTSSIPAGGCSPIPLGQSVEQSCTNGISAGSECTFSCSTPTLTLNGIDKTTCYNGLWSESSYPFCTVQTSSACPSITNGPGVQMSCSDDYNANSICSFTCAGDRTLSGPETVTCQQSYWTEPSPICLASLGCQVLANPANALLSCTNGNSINSVCTFSCLPPYKMNGEPIITCQSSRSWVPDPPACYTPSCSILTSPADGLVSCSNANSFESVCTFTCNEGASLTGEAVLTCSNAGKWSHPKPTCSGKCSELGELENGQISCANEYNVGTACVFSCADGYSVRGEPVTTCTPEKTWSDPPPTCFNRESVRCHPLLSELFKTGLTCTNLNKIDSTCDLKCEDGTSQEKFFCREAVNDDGAAWFHKDACEAGGDNFWFLPH